MSFDESFSVNRKSQKYFEGVLPETWLERAQSPDFYVDYVVELDADNAPSGVKAAVQLKGTSKANYGGGAIKQSIKTKHLAYYVDCAPEPVFLVVVDTVAEKGFWIFLPEWAKGISGWRDKKTVTVPVPTENKLEDIDSLRAAIEAAVLFMREERPSSVAAAARHLTETFEAIDDRFEAKVTYDDGDTRVTLKPRETVDGTISVKGPNAKEKFTTLIKQGKPTHFEPGELVMTGSEIFDEILRRAAEKGITAHSVKRIECTVSIMTWDARGAERPMLPNLDAVIEAGTDEATLRATLPRSPLQIQTSIELNSKDGIGLGRFGFNFEYEKWSGQDLTLASHFDRLYETVRCASEGERLFLQCEVDGNLFFKASLNIDDGDAFKPMAQFLGVVEKARVVAKHLGISPGMPTFEDLEREEEDILLLWHIVTDGCYEQGVTDASGTIELPAGDAKRLFLTKRPPDSIEPVLGLRYYPVPDFLGCATNGWHFRQHVTHVRLTDDSAKELAARADDDTRPIAVQAYAVPESICIATLVQAKGA